MNRRMVLYVVGNVIKIEALLLLLPTVCALIYKEKCVTDFLISIALCVVAGFALTLISRPGNKVIYAREGFVIVAISWLALSVFGALPFFLSGEIPSYIDAFFETVSGFTTTGASILSDVERMSKGLLFWRSLSQWIGGMGVLVFVMAIVPTLSDRSIHLLRAESPGPIVGKLVPKIRTTTRILYIIYIALTLLEVVFLLIGKMPLFESLIHAFSTAGTGGFSSKADSIASYSPYLQWVITVFMLLFGVNFNLYYLVLIKKFSAAFKSTELKVYIGIFFACAAAIAINIYSLYESLGEAIRAAAFQVAAIITTTAYATADINIWPGFSKTILLVLMFIGGCAGSTAGGFKVSRIVILAKTIKRQLQKMLHPRSVAAVKFEGKKLDEATIGSVNSYLAIYALFFFAVVLIVSIEPFDFETNISAVVACINNIGPGFGKVSSTMNYSLYSDFTKVLLSVVMLFGRLEIYPLILTLSPSTWVKK